MEGFGSVAQYPLMVWEAQPAILLINLQLMNRCVEMSLSGGVWETPFHNIPDIVGQVKGKVSTAAKLLKGVTSERLRFELEHAMLSLANCLSLLEE